MNGPVIMTSMGLAALKEELTGLKNKKLPAIVDRLARAREEGDLSENSAYQAAKEELGFVQGRIDELEEIIRNSKVSTNNGKLDVVGVGSAVTVKINGKNDTFTIVGEWEARPAAKKISASSPLGQALVGKRVGDKVEVNAPAGKVVYSIVSIG